MNSAMDNINNIYSAIYNGTPVTHASYMILYSQVYGICIKSFDNSKQVYEEYMKMIDVKTNQYADILKGFQGNILECYDRMWTSYNRCSKVICNLLSYINRHFVSRMSDSGVSVYDINTLMMRKWHTNVINKNLAQLTHMITVMMDEERNGNNIDKRYIKSYVKSCLAIDMEVYKSCIEGPLYINTMSYYKKEIDGLLGKMTVVDIIHHIEKRIKEEEHRIDTYFHSNSKHMHIKNCESAMIHQNIHIIMDDLIGMLERDNLDDIRCMYRLVSIVSSSIPVMATTIHDHIVKTGLARIGALDMEADNATEYVELLSGICTHYNKMATDSCNDNSAIKNNINNALMDIVNKNNFTAKNQFKTAEMLSKAIDSYIKNNTENMDNLFDSVMTVYRYLQDRDAFQKFYMKMYAKRLIGGSANDDMEINMIGRLKEVSDYEFINRLQKMMNDIKTSRDLNAKFKAVCGSEKIDMNMMVLTSGPWPLVKGVDIILPAELAHCVDRFTAFYHSNCSGRKLNWIINQSKGEIKTLYTTKPKSTTKLAYTFSASTFQIAILLCFNANDNLTIENIAQMTGIEIKMLEAQLELLVKMKILTVKDNTSLGNTYSVNLKYNYKKLKVKIDMPIKMETKAEADDTKKLVDEDRGFMIDACVVRIMKSRNVMKHVELIDETIKQLSQRFKPDVKMIKKKIDSLIEREYMKRAEGKRDEYHYVA